MKTLSDIEKKLVELNNINRITNSIFHQVTTILEFNSFDIELQHSILLLLNRLLVEKSFPHNIIKRIVEIETGLLYLTTGKSSTSLNEARIVKHIIGNTDMIIGSTK